jgi:hypothetical protein
LLNLKACAGFEIRNNMAGAQLYILLEKVPLK